MFASAPICELPRRMKTRPLRAAGLGGLLYGAIVYGLVLSLIHVLHNRLGSTRDALVTGAAFALLYGLAGAAAFLAGYGLARLRPAEAAERVERGAWIGLLVFNLGFWELFWLLRPDLRSVPLRPGLRRRSGCELGQRRGRRDGRLRGAARAAHRARGDGRLPAPLPFPEERLAPRLASSGCGCRLPPRAAPPCRRAALAGRPWSTELAKGRLARRRSGPRRPGSSWRWSGSTVPTGGSCGR